MTMTRIQYIQFTQYTVYSNIRLTYINRSPLAQPYCFLFFFLCVSVLYYKLPCYNLIVQGWMVTRSYLHWHASSASASLRSAVCGQCSALPSRSPAVPSQCAPPNFFFAHPTEHARYISANNGQGRTG